MAEHGRLKDPVLHVIGFGRALGATIGDPNSFQNVFSNLSQRVLTPATVFSFYQPTAMIPGQTTYFGPEFQLYPPALAIQRANFIYGIITGQYGSAYAIDRAPFQAAAGDPAALVDMVNQRLMMGRMSSQLRQVLITATQRGAGLGPQPARHRRDLPGGDLQRVHGLRRRLQRRRRHPDQRPVADRAHRRSTSAAT